MKINSSFKKVAILAAKEAGKIIEKNFRRKIKIWKKKGEKVELVTSIDFLAEEIIRKIIKNNFPTHDIFGEEEGGKIGKGFSWIIDPLDGTSNYVMGLPFFSTALILLKKENPILGVVFNPITKDLYLAEKGKGAFLNQRKIRVNKINNLSNVLLGFNKGKDLVGGLKVLTKIAPHVRTIRFYGSAQLDICQVAAGKNEGFIAVKPHYYDMGAGAFIVQEAGGKATDFNGENYNLNSSNIIVTNGKIHNQLLKLIK